MTSEPMNAARVAGFAAKSDWSTLPAPVQDRTRELLADTVGVIVAGMTTRASQIVRRTVQPLASDSTGVHHAMMWATDGSSLDFDDGHVAGGGIHPSSTIVAALLASVHGEPISGEQFLTAQLVGYETAVRAGALLYPQQPTDRYHCAGTAAAIGAAVGAARLRTDDENVIERALGIASAYAPMAGFALPMVKESIGWGAATAVMAARLAQEGFHELVSISGSPAVRPTSFGHPTVFDEPAAQESDFVGSLGRTFEIRHGYVKPYACCRLVHSSVDAILAIMAEQRLDGGDVESVRVRTHAAAAELTAVEPTSLEDAQYSLPLVIGAVLTFGLDGARGLSEEIVADERVRRAAKSVIVEHDRNQDRLYPTTYPAAVVVSTATGQRFELMRTEPSGDQAVPLSTAELESKFRFNTRRLEAQERQTLWDLCLRFEHHDAAELREALLRVGVRDGPEAKPSQ